MTNAVEFVAECSITCPTCAQVRAEVMPADACIFSYVCTGCGAELRATAGRCIYCAFGTVPCPPVQIAAARGERGERAHCCQGPVTTPS
ncbi:MAG: GDCCVxC domain-containing (seleno)protein [Proteobacteria bacterium]|nr:GDCCVxC domain-containing (seleno)protein [Pseudomonadota bacterium]